MPEDLWKDVFPVCFTRNDVAIVSFEQALPSALAGYLGAVQELDPQRDFREQSRSYLNWLDGQTLLRRNSHLEAPFGTYLYLHYVSDILKDAFCAAGSIVPDDRDAGKDNNVPGDGFLGGSYVIPSLRESGLWEVTLDHRCGLCQEFANRQGRAARFNMITTAPELVAGPFGQFGFVPDCKITVSDLGEVDLLYRVFQPEV